MSRPKSIINPIPGERLKTICEETGIKHKQLAAQIFLTPQTISKIINGKANLTRDTAERVISQYPAYRIEWLLAMDEVKTHKQQAEINSEQFMKFTAKHKKDYENRMNSIVTIAALCGYELVLYSTEYPDGDTYILRNGEQEKFVSEHQLDKIIDELLVIGNFHFERLLKLEA